VIQSKNEKFKVGDHVTANFGWVSHCICSDKTVVPFTPITKVELPPDQLSRALGVLGLTG